MKSRDLNLPNSPGIANAPFFLYRPWIGWLTVAVIILADLIAVASAGILDAARRLYDLINLQAIRGTAAGDVAYGADTLLVAGSALGAAAIIGLVAWYVSLYLLGRHFGRQHRTYPVRPLSFLLLRGMFWALIGVLPIIGWYGAVRLAYLLYGQGFAGGAREVRLIEADALGLERALEEERRKASY